MTSADTSQAEALFFAGVQQMQAGDLAAAALSFRQALGLHADFAEAMANLAFLRELDGAPAEAEQLYRRALEINPSNLQVRLNLATLLLRAKRFADAETQNRQALLLSPDAASAWSSLGVLLACLQREAEAEDCYRHALETDPAFDRARYNLAYLLLRQGRLEEGWACREARDHFRHLSDFFTCARWQGEALAGKSIVLGFEAGHGDMIQFVRYAPLLKKIGAAKVALVCHPELQRLLTTLEGIARLYNFNEDVPADGWDYWTPVMSLPHFCRTTLATIPAQLPYLSAAPEEAAKWATRLQVQAGSGLKVGLAWQGNPLFENDVDRSLPVDALAPLAGLTGVDFISLQKPAAGAPAFALFDAGPALTDFADTAALISQLDLVITVDTAVAHLAGSLNVPCWLLLPDYRCDWRWLTDRSDSPWYPHTMRLFRQPPAAGWAPVMAEVRSALAGLAYARQAAHRQQ